MQGSPGRICSPTTIMAGCQQFKTYHQGRQPPPFWFHSTPGRRGKLPAAIGQCYPKLRLLAAGNGVGVPRLALLSLPTSLPLVFYHYLQWIYIGIHTGRPVSGIQISTKWIYWQASIRWFNHPYGLHSGTFIGIHVLGNFIDQSVLCNLISRVTIYI